MSKEQILGSINARLRHQHLESKLLLKPLEIALKHRTETVNLGQEETEFSDMGMSSVESLTENILNSIGVKVPTKSNDRVVTRQATEDMPVGLNIAIKDGSIHDNRFKLVQIPPYKPDRIKGDIKKLRDKHQDCLLSFMKPPTHHNKTLIPQNRETLSICVCMYSEDVRMLRTTLRGIQENIVMMAKNGTSSDDISVVVILDGIEKMDESIVDFFESMHRQCGTYVEEDIKDQDFEDWQEKMAKAENDEVSLAEEPLTNLSSVLFSEEDLSKRTQKRFKHVYQEWMDSRKLLKQMSELKRKKEAVAFDALPDKLQKIFLELAERQSGKKILDYDRMMQQMVSKIIKKTKNAAQEQKITQQMILNYYTNNVERYKSMLIRAINQTSRLCKEYLDSRDNLAYLGSFRKRIKIENEQGHFDEDDDEESEVDLARVIFEGFESEAIKKKSVYMNLFMCVKYRNSGKLNSHNWFFNGFCKELHPKYAVLLDVGLRPFEDALYKMYEYLKRDQQVGGVCGYMGLKIERMNEEQQVKDDQVDCISQGFMHFVDIQRTQQVQYHFAHLIDKPFEAQFDFIHVLPGAYSAYNMNSLTKVDQNGNTLFKDYFKSIDQKLKSNKIVQEYISPLSAFFRVILPEGVYRCFDPVDPYGEEIMLQRQNVNLAEDRILCMGIHRNGYKMHYLPDAYAEVDPIKTVHGLMGQRRRWINGSFFAFSKVKGDLRDMSDSNNNCECCLSFQVAYLSFMNALSYIAPSIFLFTVHIAMEVIRTDLLPKIFKNVANNDNSLFYQAFVYTMDFFYVMLIGTITFMSINFGHSQKRFRPYIYAISTIFGIFQLIVVAVLAIDLIRSTSGTSAYLQSNESFTGSNPGGEQVLDIFRWLLLSAIALPAVPVIFYLIFFQKGQVLMEIIAGTFSSMFYSPTYLIILSVFALARIDDISWGTKGMNKQAGGASQHLKQSWKILKMIQIFKWFFWNSICGIIFLSFGSSYLPRFIISFVLLGVILLTMTIKVLIAIVYYFIYRCCRSIDLPEFNAFNIKHSKIHSQAEALREGVLMEVTDNFNQIYEETMENQKQMSQIAGGIMGLMGRKQQVSEVSRNQISFLYQLNKKEMKKNQDSNIVPVAPRKKSAENPLGGLLSFLGKMDKPAKPQAQDKQPVQKSPIKVPLVTMTETFELQNEQSSAKKLKPPKEVEQEEDKDERQPQVKPNPSLPLKQKEVQQQFSDFEQELPSHIEFMAKSSTGRNPTGRPGTERNQR